MRTLKVSFIPIILLFSCSLAFPTEPANSTFNQTIRNLQSDLKIVREMLQDLQPKAAVERKALHALAQWNRTQEQLGSLPVEQQQLVQGRMRDLEEQVQSLRSLLQLPGSAKPRSTSADPGAINGWITDSATGDPIPWVEVHVYDACGWAGYGSTDENGKFSVQDLPEGVYTARTYGAENYADELYDNIPCWQGDCDVNDGTQITVRSGSITTNINFQLRRTGSISGRVLGVGLQPIEYYHVHVFNSAGEEVQYGYPDENGIYHAEGLLAGTYYVMTHVYNGYQNKIYNNIPCADFYECDPLVGTPVSVALGTDTGGIDFQLQEFGSISGQVTDAVSGAPLVDIELDIYDSNGWWAGWTTTGSRGKYLSPGLPAGIYHVRTYNHEGYVDEVFKDISCSGGCDVTQGRPVEVKLGQKTRKVNFALSRN